MTVEEALAILGNPDATEDSVKRAYRKAALRYHPDRPDGNLELMKLVNLAYETLQRVGFTWSSKQANTAQSSIPLTETIQHIWDAIKHYPGIHGELIGTWLWVTGTTYPIKEYLKELGFQFSSYKRAWYWHDGPYHKLSRKRFTIDELRRMYDVHDLETEEVDQLVS